MIKDAIERYVTYDPPRAEVTYPKLWCSELGGCPRKAILRLRGYPVTIPFPPRAREAMHNGVIYEADTLAALQFAYGNDHVTGQLVLSDEHWSGKSDMVLDHPSSLPVIVEHKATNDKWWNYNGSLPTLSHVAQLYLYGWLYRKTFGVTARLILFYRAWGHYAELDICPQPERVQVVGTLDFQPISKTLPINLDAMRLEMEQWLASPDLPPVLSNPADGCTFQSKPSCAMYYHCWSQQE